ncbi:hypothetical protein [Laspinema olomoucense]|nr:hypothetical protein [Laspinema sp. D3c]
MTESDPLVDPEDPRAFPLKLVFNTIIMGWKGRSRFRGELGANQL